MEEKSKILWQEIIEYLKDNTAELNFEELKNALSKVSGVNPDEAQLIVSSLPDNFVMPNNKIANIITGDLLNELVNYRVSPKDAKKEIKSSCLITYEGNDQVVLDSKHPMTMYDRQVHDALVSLFVNGTQTFTPAMVYRTMNGTTNEDGISQKSLESIENSIFKMRFINVKADVSAELEQRHIYDPDNGLIKSGCIEDNLIDITKVEYIYENAEGKGKVTGYRLHRAPVLFAYSKLTGQLITLPSKLLNICSNGTSVRNTEQRISIKSYMLRRISAMRANPKLNRRILLSNLYTLCPTAKTRAQQKRIKDYAQTVLQYWMTQKYKELSDETYISGFELCTKKGSDYAFDIML